METRQRGLFDDVDRSDPSPARFSEGSYAFLNRVESVYWGRVRDVLGTWFNAYPDDGKLDLAARFRDRAPAQHFGAWWELYLHRLFCCLGYDVDLHVEVPGGAGRPDFRLTRDREELLVEAVTVFSGISNERRSGEREGWIKDAINEARSPNFFIWLDIDAEGMQRPSPRKICEPIEAWLATLDPDEIATRINEGEGLPELPVSVKDWKLRFRAFPVSPANRGKSGHRPLGAGPASSGFIDDAGALRRALQRKRRRYGHPDGPLVLAVLSTSGFIDNDDVEQALFGSEAVRVTEGEGSGALVRLRDGFWVGEQGPRAARVSGVLVGAALMPWTVSKTPPKLWHNPFATHALEADWPFPTARVESTGRISHIDEASPVNEVLGLPAEWPGPDRPFPR